MNIGTAKPDADTLHRLPHHLIDIVDPDQQFNAGCFVRRADPLVRQVSAERGVPVVSGGTAFYLRNFAFGLPESPPGTSSYRQGVYQEAEEVGWDRLYQELSEIDPSYAAKIGASDTARIVRALEVARTTGRPLSSFRTPSSLRECFQFLLIGLERPREDLYRRIDRRVESMFDRGLAAEFQALLDRGYTARDPGLQAIGYREFFLGLSEGLEMEEIMGLVKRNTRRYAKRQMTFFRSLPGVVWIHPDNSDRVLAVIQTFLGPQDRLS